MSFNEYYLHARGYFLRADRNKEGLRVLYRLLWNANVDRKNVINSDAILRQHWPLRTDGKEADIIEADEMRKTWNRIINKKKSGINGNRKLID